ncbi:MAG: 2-C-methyl-D-erythritol 2,4-cyclodiphosphate synthase [Gammaproteobacteria bacterium]|nr:2-C-methyl-D-erythritol 2,4-cyclodiphosphate synthase [Gammaproteobacteria bacterium]MDH3857615.1 2-C-methyl-D-erythritol 2,4-cyclodiphosphate synthase [Gammaproteobacteria bacterium]
MTRIGHGYDVHAFVEGNGFTLGGVFVSCDKAVVAHSDGDALIHALCDALLGALGRGDIGRMFPDTDVRNENRDSREFLRKIKQLIDTDGFRLGNADITIIVQVPKMAPHIGSMTAILAEDLETPATAINIKATTTEGLGFIGREQGIAVAAVVILESD